MIYMSTCLGCMLTSSMMITSAKPITLAKKLREKLMLLQFIFVSTEKEARQEEKKILAFE